MYIVYLIRHILYNIMLYIDSCANYSVIVGYLDPWETGALTLIEYPCSAR